MNDKVSVSYQLAAEGGGGIISSRDFINLRYCENREGVYICGGKIFVRYPVKMTPYLLIFILKRRFCRFP